MILHRNLIQGLEKALNESFFAENRYADKVLERILKSNKKWGSHDRAFIAEAFYEIIRWKRKFEFYANREMTRENISLIIAIYLLYNKHKLPVFPEFNKVYVKKIKARFKLDINDDSIIYSIPEWMKIRMKKELGHSWKDEMCELNKPARTILRANTLKITAEELIHLLKEEQIESELLDNYKDAVALIEKKNVFQTESFKKGLFEVQDASSQLVAEFVNPKPGMRVIDACAGAGGKTLHLACLMKNKGQIIALDIHEWKLQNLKQRARRNEIFNIKTSSLENSKYIKRLENSADRLLIDSPCSGLGVLKRNPDAKWKLKEEFIDSLIKEQQIILQNYSKLVKKGGELIYATCSILPSENSLQIKKFMEENKNFQLIEQKEIMPSISHFDGFFMAKLQRIS